MGESWRGWPDVEPAPLPRGTGPWIDLSHPLRADLPRIAGFDAPHIQRLRSQPADPYNLTELRMVCHTGTHVDAPIHFIADGPAFHDIPLARLCGAGVVLRIRAEPFGVIGRDALAAAAPAVRPGDIVILDTGWAQHAGTPRYHEHACLDVPAAEWLVERRAKLLAVDFPTPDLAVGRRPPDFAWPVHHVLLAHGVLIAENLTNLGALAGRRIEAFFLALNVVSGDGAPARVVARTVA
ncbi:MAG TPA: cyclase family protein [Solirubrobacteraceae bacterium]